MASIKTMELMDTGNLSVVAITATCILTIATYYWASRRHTLRVKSQPLEASNRPQEPKTYRVNGIPLDWDREKLRSFLMHSEHLADTVVVESLAHEANLETKTATVTLTNSSLQHSSGRSRQILIPQEMDVLFNRHLSIEKEFLGMTTLYEPLSKDHKIDVVALSGLGGHAFGSFKERGGTHMWLRDSLPGYLTSETDNRPMARIMIYGYESAVAFSQNMQNIEDLATTFHSSLLALAAGPTTRPILLIGHSLGGLIIKQALISLSRSTIPDDQKLTRAVYGVIFFGTPHDGMDISSLIPMVGDGPNRFLIESISHINSQIISMQQRDFHRALGKEGDSEVFCFYETLESPTAQQVGAGQWKMTGPTAVLVAKSSATHCRPWEDGSEHICAIARTHSDIVKFAPHDPDYRNVIQRIRGLSRRAIKARDRLQTTTSKFLVPYRQNPDFVGRSEILDQIKLQFGLGQQQDHTQPRRRVSLYGLGGVGKTQLALAYVYWIQETCPDVSVFWVHASNADRFRAAYASIAEKCGVPGREDPTSDILTLVKRWLEEQVKMQWLMVIDNADDIDAFFSSQRSDAPDAQLLQSDKLARYIPDCNHGSILITTRNKQVGIKFGQGKPPIEITKMTDEEAHQLVQSILQVETSTDETFLLASKLEHLPLALAQATSFIQENTISISDYIQLLDEGDTALVDQLSEPFEAVGRDSETPHALTTTWILSFRQIEQNHPLASDTLCFLSLLHRQAIPRIFAEEYHRQRDQAQGGVSSRLIKALGTLKAFSFISEGKDGSADIHRLVQLVTRKWLVSNGRMAEFSACAVEIVASSFPDGKFENYQTCLSYFPHATSVLQRDEIGSKTAKVNRALLLQKLIAYHSNKGEYKDMERTASLAAKIYEYELGEEHKQTLISKHGLATAYRCLGRLREAEDLATQTLKAMKQVLGDEHTDTLDATDNLMTIYGIKAQWREAEELASQQVEVRRRVQGEDHPDTLDSMRNLLAVYIGQKRWKEAEERALQLTNLQKKVPRDDIVDMGQLSTIYLQQGRLKEAEVLALQAAERCKQLLGESHPLYLKYADDIYTVYREQGRLKEAEEIEIQAMKMSKRIYGEEHYDTLTIMSNVALIYELQGRWKDAEDLVLQVIKARKKGLGEEHPHVLAGMDILARVYAMQKRWEEAEELGMHIITARKRILGEEHIDTISSLNILARVYHGQERWKEAEDLAFQVMMA
ncbi:hypothetical protein V8C35DRAFT_295770 [Trichoderma chlorosporum]